MWTRRGFIRALALAASLPVLPAMAAGPFPDQPIKMVVAFGPGTGSDTIARILAQSMTTILNTPMKGDRAPEGLRRPSFRGIHVFVSGGSSDWYFLRVSY